MSCGAPNGAQMCSVLQHYDNTHCESDWREECCIPICKMGNILHRGMQNLSYTV